MAVNDPVSGTYDWWVDSTSYFRVVNDPTGGTAFDINASSGTVTLQGSVKTNQYQGWRNTNTGGATDLVSFRSGGTERARIDWNGRGFFDQASVAIPTLPQVAHPEEGAGLPTGTVWASTIGGTRKLHVLISGTRYSTAGF